MAKTTKIGPFALALTMLGGIALGVGGIVLAIALICSSKTALIASGTTLAVAGAAFAIGWCGQLAHGGIGPVIGSLALTGAMIAALVPEYPYGYGMLRGVVMLGGLCLFAMTHYFAFESGPLAQLDVARGGAGLALFGLGTEAIMIAKQLPLPLFVQHAAAVLGVGGLVLFGFAVAASIPSLRSEA